MNIAVDGSVVFSEEHKKRLSKIGSFSYYKSRCTYDEFMSVSKDADIIIVDKTFFNESIEKLKCRMIAIEATGIDAVDTKRCRKSGITVTNVPGYSSYSVSEHVFMFIMEFAKKFMFQDKIIRQGLWKSTLPETMPLTELKGKTIGIIGYGNIGKRTAKIAKGFDMKILVSTTSKHNDKSISFVSLDELLKRSDFVSIHVPLNDSTRDMITKKEISMMKRTAYLINTARGPIVNEKDLIAALKNKTIAGAALDAFDVEPLPSDHPFFKLDNVLLTPHTAFCTKEAIERLGFLCIENIENFLNNKMTNVVN
jgi:phosphoglycerate dehydrogenase-like enzyme